MLSMSKHAEKIWKMKFILNFSDKNWNEIRIRLEKFRKEIKINRLNDNIKSQLLYRQHDVKNVVEYLH